MNPASADVIASTSNSTATIRKGLQFILQAVAKAPLHVIADTLHCDESGACRVRTGERKVTLTEALQLIEALGFKSVDKDAICVRKDRYDYLTRSATLFGQVIQDEEQNRKLFWEDEQ